MRVPDRDVVAALRGFDSCSLSNAIETFDVRLRNEGFARAGVRCVLEDLPPMVGYAVTARIRSSAPPPVGHSYYDRTDWWNHILSVPEPRIVVAQDVDEQPGLGAFVGGVHANVLRALGCVGYVTNGSVRDLPAVEAIGFQMFAGSVAVSHAFVHVLDFGEPVEVGGLRVSPGELLHGDRHGLISIPREIAADIPRVAAGMLAHDRHVIEFCRSPEFSLERLRSLVNELG
jgi:4-hydroxy-4-methyl-2-oxoglutarate aldolase